MFSVAINCVGSLGMKSSHLGRVEFSRQPVLTAFHYTKENILCPVPLTTRPSSGDLLPPGPPDTATSYLWWLLHLTQRRQPTGDQNSPKHIKEMGPVCILPGVHHGDILEPPRRECHTGQENINTASVLGTNGPQRAPPTGPDHIHLKRQEPSQLFLLLNC